MSRWFERMSEVLERHGGTVENFIGDAVMAIFGIPELHETTRCARSAPQPNCEARSRNSTSGLERELGVRIGTSASASIPARSSPETGTREQMLVTGDPVNVAKRLEEAARTGEILVRDGSCKLVENASHLLEPRDEVDGVKGEAGPVIAWNVSSA